MPRERLEITHRFDERLLELQRERRIGTFAPVKGQEAAQVGAVAALTERDWVVPAFRETAAALLRGVPLADIILYNAGYDVIVPLFAREQANLPSTARITHAARAALESKA